jgi:hypothetical protein
MRTPQRIYRASHIADGVRLVAKLQQRVLKEAPMSAGPLTALAPPAPAAGAEAPELAEAHCHGCKGKKTFQVEGTETMENGALRKHGTAVCGHKVSTFAKGEGAASAGT